MIQRWTYINRIESILPCMVEWINVLSAIYLASTLLFPFEYQRPAFYVYALTLLLDIVVNQRYKNVRWINAKWTFVTMILFYLCIWLWHPFEMTDLAYFQTTAEKRIGLLIAGILGLFTNINPRLKPHYLAIPIMLTGIVTFVYVLLQIDFWHNSYESFKHYQIAIAEYRGLRMLISHMKFNLYMNCGIVFGIYGMVVCKKLWEKVIYAFLIMVSTALIITSEGRIGLFTILVIICIIAYYWINKTNKHLLIPLTSILIIAATIIFSSHYRVKESQLTHDPRIDIWNISLDMIQEKPVLGYGVSDGRSIFVNKLFENEDLKRYFLNPWFDEFPNYNKYSLHAHNIFLESTIEFGVVGLILISLILILPLLLTQKRKQIFLALFILIFTLQGLTESPGTHLSIFILSWFLYILILTPIDKNEAIEK